MSELVEKSDAQRSERQNNNRYFMAAAKRLNSGRIGTTLHMENQIQTRV